MITHDRYFLDRVVNKIRNLTRESYMSIMAQTILIILI